MSRLTGRLCAFGAFWWDFVVGEDWRIAGGVVIAFGVVALLAGDGVSAWWLIPAAALGMLSASVIQAVRTERRD